MEEKRFDDLARLIGRGASRRSILKGLLGLGGAATSGALATVSSADARTLRTRSTVTTAPPPDCEPGHQFCGGQGLEYCCPPGQCFDGLCCPEGTERCGDECVPAGQCTSSGDQCATGNPCGTACCPADASCARSGNSDICCGGSAGGVPCGLDCCSEPLQCCDGECCAGGMVCLGQVYGGYEEVCCPTEQTCDGQCCQGTCYTPLGTSLSGFERACCPAEANLCYGTDAFAGVAVCCQGETPDCCANPDGSPVCLTVEQCCTAEECGHLTDPSTCQIGDCSGFACHAQQICDENEECCAGGANTCCPTSQSCCGPICCDAGLSCCERDVEGTLTFICYDASLDGACCDDSECPGNPATCEEGACLADQTCGLRTMCAGGERCCEGDAQTAGTCITAEQCCDIGDCAGLDDPVTCAEGVCVGFACDIETTCNAGEHCCGFGDDFCCPDGETCCRREENGVASFLCLSAEQCCDDDDCTEYATSYCDVANDQCDCIPLTCDDYPEYPCGEGFPDGCGDTLYCDCGGDESCCLRDSGDNGIEVGVCIDPEEQCCDAWDCQEFGYHIDCVICTDEFECQEANEDVPCGEEGCGVCDDEGECRTVDNDAACPDGVCCDGFCTEVGSCSECGLAGSDCSADGDCCSDWCCDGTCITPNQCCDIGDCPACHLCNFNFCIADCRVEPDFCCDSDEFCRIPTGNYGYCEPCHTIGENCSGTPYVPCCDDLLCSNFTCATCVSLNEFGCSSFDDCCDDGSKVCVSGACRCGTPDLYNICTRDGNECCEGYYCTSTSSLNEPLRGLCTEEACSSTIGAPCPCCAGYLCATDGNCYDFCDYVNCDDD